jgi:hypothetical protein
MAFSAKVEALFKTHPMTLIDFAVDDLKVNPTTMKKLAASIKDGTIGIEIKDTGSKLSAAYSRKRIILRKESEADYPEGRAAFVHEGVHAWADLSRFTSGVLDECAGYLTEVVYLMHLKRKISGHPIYDAANALAASKKLGSKRGQKLTRADCQPLSDAIKADSAYQGLSE